MLGSLSLTDDRELSTSVDVYTAAMTILVERILEVPEDNPQESSSSNTWDAAIDVLRSYSVVADSAKKCIAALEVLSQNFPSEDSHTGLASSQNSDKHNPESLLQMDLILEQQASILPFGMDDFLWLG